MFDSIAHLDFPAVLTCEASGCDARAMWVGRWPCCNDAPLFCGPHRTAMEEALARASVQHTLCLGRAVMFLRWTPLGVMGRG